MIDREAVETRTALLRMAYAEPGKPERPELARLDRFAIDQAVRDTLREHAAGLPVLSSAELMFPPGTDRKDAKRVLDLTPLVLTRLGIDAVDQRVIEDAAARGWMGTSGISPNAEASGLTKHRPSRQIFLRSSSPCQTMIRSLMRGGVLGSVFSLSRSSFLRPLLKPIPTQSCITNTRNHA